MSEFTKKIIEFPEVSNFETGEVLKPVQKIEISTRENVPFRSITDLKGFNDNETPCHSSLTSTVDYVPLETLVTQIFRSKTIKELRDMQIQDPSDYDDDEEFEVYEDPVEQMDFVNGVVAQSEQEGSRPANADREHSGAGATTPGEANGEAASDGSAG